MATLLEDAVKSLKRNCISSVIFESEENLLDYLDTLIDDGVTVGVGDSITLEALGVYDYLKKRDITYYNKYDEALGKEDKKELYLKNFQADYFLSSANAISSDGKIYNMDGNGSRVAPIIYGPKKVLIICGVNKIVKDEKDAVERIRAHAQ